MVRYAVTTTIFVEAADASEAALIIERDFAGRFDSELVCVSAHAAVSNGSRCPACGSERVEYHEDIVARRHFLRVDENGLFVFQSITDSFDDDGDNPRLWCGDCSHEWSAPDQVDFE